MIKLIPNENSWECMIYPELFAKPKILSKFAIRIE
jgi:hypothetical protein